MRNLRTFQSTLIECEALLNRLRPTSMADLPHHEWDTATVERFLTCRELGIPFEADENFVAAPPQRRPRLDSPSESPRRPPSHPLESPRRPPIIHQERSPRQHQDRVPTR
jgi:hypothetical protein